MEAIASRPWQITGATVFQRVPRKDVNNDPAAVEGPREEYLVSGDSQGTIKLWDPSKRIVIKQLHTHSAFIWWLEIQASVCVFCAMDGSVIGTSSSHQYCECSRYH